MKKNLKHKVIPYTIVQQIECNLVGKLGISIHRCLFGLLVTKFLRNF